jgi:cyclopropane-fatty-acyl-phospholipid synthase
MAVTSKPATRRPADLASRGSTGRTAADTLDGLLRGLLGADSPVRLRCWDGSEAGPADAPVVILRSPAALRHLLWAPGELGLARAYVSGELDGEGDLYPMLQQVWQSARQAGLRPPRGPAGWLRAAAAARRLGAFGPRPAVPAGEARLRGRLHSVGRDRGAIAHHYDLGNDFYQLLLDPQMAYSCAYWARDEPGYSLEDAQRDKLDLICRKLDLRPGMRLLDVGCGWGSLLIHAAGRYGVDVVGVTLSAAQYAHVQSRIYEAGLDGLAQVRLAHYRDEIDGHFDAISAIEMSEHVGEHTYPAFAARLHSLLRPRGRLLLQQMSRPASELKDGSRVRVTPGGGPFIEAYIAPDMHMRPLADTLGHLERAGFEVRDVEAMREHYVRTVRAWSRTLEERWAEFTALAGVETARIWRLYLAGGALAFADNRMGVDQVLAVRPGPAGDSAVELLPTWRAPAGAV